MENENKEYKGLFENPVEHAENPKDEIIQRELETTETSQQGLDELIAKITKALDEKVEVYIHKLKDIEEQQKIIQDKIIQQYKETLASEITDDKLKNIIFKGVK